MDNRITKAKFLNGARLAYTEPLWRYDYGQELTIEGLTLPTYFEVHFSDTIHGNAVTGLYSDGKVSIPDVYLQKAGTLYAWVYLHDTEDDGETEYQIVTEVKERAKPTHETPTPVQQSEIEQLIASLETAVTESETNVTHYPKIEDGYWYVWDAENEEWSNTGIEATGPEGPQGPEGEQGPQGPEGPQGEPGEVTTAQMNAAIEAAIISILPKKTVTGAVVSISDAQPNLPLADLTAQIVANQSGSGDPSHSNIRPSSGFTGVNVIRCGSNLWNEDWEVGGINDSTGQPNSDTNKIRSKSFFSIKGGETYYVVAPQPIRVLFYKADETFISETSNIRNNTFVVPSNASKAKIQGTVDYGTVYNRDISINYPSSDTTYHAYSANTYSVSWQTEAGEIVDGTIDIVSGLLTVEHVKQVYRGDDLDTFSLSYGQAAPGYTHMYFGINNTPLGKNFAQQLHTKSNMGVIANAQSSAIPSSEGFAVLNISNPDRLIVYWYVNLTWASANDFKTWLNNNPFELYYQLATPQTYQLTPTEVKTLLGVNNIFADTGDVAVKYSVDLNSLVN